MSDKFDCDYLVVGGGTIGLPTSLWLAESTSKNVICVEAGSSTNVKKISLVIRKYMDLNIKALIKVDDLV